MQTLIIHGRQPELGMAELESIFGAGAIRPIDNVATLLDIEPAQINFFRLGGMVKFCKVLTTLETTDWQKIEQFLVGVSPGHAENMEPGKLTIGLSAYGLKVQPKRLMATGLELKKVIRNTGRTVRLVPNKHNDLNAAQVLHNKLTQKLGWELVFVRDGNRTIVAQSIAVQDIEAYTARDRARPYRDARVGMLPPKLAQIIINLAAGELHPHLLWDPFCGTGVLLQEALLMGIDVRGSDIDPRMIEYSKANLDWLSANKRQVCPGAVEMGKECTLEVADATEYKYEAADVIACEAYLGKPLSSLPKPRHLEEIAQECDDVLKKFLKNIAGQTKPGFRMCVAVPAWKTKEGFKHVPTLDKLSDLGYNRLSFVHVSDEKLIYHRPDQVVARELIVLKRT